MLGTMTYPFGTMTYPLRNDDLPPFCTFGTMTYPLIYNHYRLWTRVFPLVVDTLPRLLLVQVLKSLGKFTYTRWMNIIENSIALYA